MSGNQLSIRTSEFQSYVSKIKTQSNAMSENKLEKPEIEGKSEVLNAYIDIMDRIYNLCGKLIEQDEAMCKRE